MNKTVKEALAKGKVLRDERDQKLAKEAKEAEEAKKAKEAKEKAELDAEVERCLSYVPDALARTIGQRESSFNLVTYESDKGSRFSLVCALLEPKLKKMGLQFKHTSSQSWVQLTYDPDTGYDATYYHLSVLVPEEAV
jgi:hypothetical protein